MGWAAVAPVEGVVLGPLIASRGGLCFGLWMLCAVGCRLVGEALPGLFPRLSPVAFSLCRCLGVLVVGTAITAATEGLRLPVLTAREWLRLTVAAAAMGYGR